MLRLIGRLSSIDVGEDVSGVQDPAFPSPLLRGVS